MAQEQQLAHRVITNPALPYKTYSTPSSTEPQYVFGSTDILTSGAGFAQRRPGFANTVEQTPTTFNNLQRLFTWDRYNGLFYIMACDINASGFSQVFKLEVGTDVSFVSIYTDTNSNVPFDFVTSNNTVYFSNGSTAKKWDPLNGLSNWGIAIASVNSSVSNYVGTGSQLVGPNAWANPTNIQGAPNLAYATNTISVTGTGSLVANQTSILQGVNYGFAIPVLNTVLGVQVTFTGLQSNQTRSFLGVRLTYNNASIGNLKFGNLPSVAGTLVLGSASDTWGAALTPAIVNNSTFGVWIQGVVQSTVGTTACTFSVDAVQITIFQVGGPNITVNGPAAAFTATAGYTYVYCYGNSATGHISSPTLPSNNSGVFTNQTSISIPVVASTDPQVNQIRLFRTTDGGGGTYFELPTSPYANSTATLTDSAPDQQLNVASIAPTPTFNDPPTPFQQPIYFSGRIWGFVGNKVWFSGLEEINQGVPEESFPSGIAGNFWAFDQPVQALGVAGMGDGQVLVVFCGGRFYGITGNTLDTFRRFQISNRRGCRSLATAVSLGGMLGWLDSSSQLWATDGSVLNELAIDIRPDLANVIPALCSMTFHVAGRFHWCVFSSGTKLFVYDMDMGQWMPPWIFSAKYIYSGETAAGNYVLMASTGTLALQLNPVAFNDNGATYQPVLKTGLMSVVPDYGTRFSYIGMGSYNEPTRTGFPTTFQITNNAQALADVLILSDDDPSVSAYTSIAANLQDTATTFNRVNGTAMKQWVYPTNSPTSRWISLQIKLANADQLDRIYEIFMAYKQFGGR